MPNPLTRNKNNRGYSLTELALCLGLLGVVFLATDWFQDSSETALVDANRQSQAVAIAQGQQQVVAGAVRYDELQPTGNFMAAGWITQPGYDVGVVPVQIWVDGEPETQTPILYEVYYAATNADDSGRLRQVTIRVEWDRADGSRGEYSIDTMRAG